MAASAVALALIAGPAHSQIGAIGVVPGGTASGTGALVGTPVFTNSALALPKGNWAFSGVVGLTRTTAELFDPNLNDNFTRKVTSISGLVVGGYALGDRLLIGALLPPVTRIEVKDEFQGQTSSESETGTGDPIAFVKYQIAKSGDGRTSFAGLGNVSIPVGKDGFGSHGAKVSLGAVASHQIGKLTLHAEGSAAIPTKDEDGNTIIGVNAAGVYSVARRIWANAEVLTSISDGEYVILGAPSLRFGIGQRMFFDLGVSFKAVSSLDGASPFTALAGLVFVP
jgi:hypothetical protein